MITATIKKEDHISIVNVEHAKINGEVTIAGVHGNIDELVENGYNNGKKKTEKSDVLGIQQYSTPKPVINKLIVNVNNDNIVIVLYNHDIVKALVDKGIDEKNIIFISDNIAVKGSWLTKNGIEVDTCGDESNPKWYFMLNDTITKALIKKKNKNMDTRDKEVVIISNPPYENNIDLDILYNALPKCDKAYIVHPASYLLNNKDNSNFIKFIKKFGAKVSNVHLFNGNKLFDVELFTGWTMTEFDMHKSCLECHVIDEMMGKRDEYDADSILDITWYGSSFYEHELYDIFSTLYDHIEKHGSLDNHCVHSKLTDYSVKFARIRGHVCVDKENNMLTDDFFTMLCNDANMNCIGKEYEKSKNGKRDLKVERSNMWSFNSEAERHNFIIFLRSKIARFFLSYYKINKNLSRGELEIVPWMDFTKVWNDKSLKEKFGITDDQWHYIDNFIPDYYDEYRYDAE